ncbi:MAG: 6-phosphofructokinase [Eubacteriales bacterium]
MKYNAIVGQSGGPTAAINATLAGVIAGAMASDKIETLYGARNGVAGILEGRICNLSEIFKKSADDLDELTLTPAAALGSCRMKLPVPGDPKGDEVYSGLFAFFKERNIRYFFYIGGNDSMDTVAKLSKAAPLYGADGMQFIGVPKTIDNDLCETDHTPGFGSAAKYIAASIQDILYDCAVYTVKSVTIVEIMGRDSGWLTCAAALPRLNGMEPDYLYLPEVPFDMETFLSDIERAHQRHPNVVIAVSEGVRFADGRYVGEGTQSGVSDVFGHKYLAGAAKTLEYAVRDRFGCKVRSFDLNLPQRCASFLLSENDIRESVGVGKAAVQAAEQGQSRIMMTYVRSDDPYTITYLPRDVEEIANRVKTVPMEFITPEHNSVTDACLDYLLPIVSGEIPQKIQNGIPHHYRIPKD